MKSNYSFLQCRIDGARWKRPKAKSRDFILSVIIANKKWNRAISHRNRAISYFWLAKFENGRKRNRAISFWIQNILWNENEIYNLFWDFWNVSKACICNILWSFPQRKHMYVSLISYLLIIYWASLILFLWKFFSLLKHHLWWASNAERNLIFFLFSRLKSFLPKLPQFLLILYYIYIANWLGNIFTSSDSQQTMRRTGIAKNSNQ